MAGLFTRDRSSPKVFSTARAVYVIARFPSKLHTSPAAEPCWQQLQKPKGCPCQDPRNPLCPRGFCDEGSCMAYTYSIIAVFLSAIISNSPSMSSATMQKYKAVMRPKKERNDIRAVFGIETIYILVSRTT